MVRKFLRTIWISLAVFVLSGAVLGVLSNRAYADDNDNQAINRAGAAMDDLLQLSAGFDPNDEAASHSFYQIFAARAIDNTNKMQQAQEQLGKTTETGASKAAVEDLRTQIDDVRVKLSTLQHAARNEDDDGFAKANESFSEAVHNYNLAVRAYNQTLQDKLDQTATFYRTIFMASAVVSTIAFVWALAGRRGPAAQRAQRWKVAAHSLWPLAGAGLNAYIYFYSSIPPYLGFCGVVFVGFVPLAWAIHAYWQSRKGLPASDNRLLAVSPKAFFALSLLTVGIYPTYWGWKAWRVVGIAEGKTYHATLRAILLPITCFALFKKIQILAVANGYKGQFNAAALAAGFLGASVLYNATWFIDDAKKVVAATVVSFVLFALLPVPAVRAYNSYVLATKKQIAPLGSSWQIVAAITVLLLASIAAGVVVEAIRH